MITVNAIGDTCPIPVVKTKKAIEALTQPDTVETLVDNEVAVENLKKMAAQKGYSCDSSKLDDGSYSVKLTIEAVNADELSDTDEASQYACRPAADNRVVVIRSSYMGEGSEELGKVLIKGFIYALSQQDNPPETMLFYNGGAKLTCEGSKHGFRRIVLLRKCIDEALYEYTAQLLAALSHIGRADYNDSVICSRPACVL